MNRFGFLMGLGMTALLLFTTACGGEKGAGNQTAAPAPSKPPEVATAAKTALAAKPSSAATAAPKQSPFSAEMSAEFMRKVMETSARIEAVKKEIAERQKVIFETNPEVKAYRTRLIKMQKKINKIMAKDTELAELKLNRDILWSTMPTLPRGNVRPGTVRGFGPMK